MNRNSFLLWIWIPVWSNTTGKHQRVSAAKCDRRLQDNAATAVCCSQSTGFFGLYCKLRLFRLFRLFVLSAHVSFLERDRNRQKKETSTDKRPFGNKDLFVCFASFVSLHYLLRSCIICSGLFLLSVEVSLLFLLRSLSFVC